MMSSRILLFFLLASPLSLFAQNVDIRGIVSDSVTGERLVYANVLLKDIHKGATTNTQGFFLIPNVDTGYYEIHISYVGYDTEVRFISVSGPDPITLHIKLKPSPVEKPEIEVIGRRSTPITETLSSVHVLEQTQLKMVPVTLQEDVFRSILVLPGVISTSDVTSHFFVRGGASDQNLILFDGMRVYNPYHAFGILSIFDPNLIRSTEVYLGAFPPGFGSRLSSVVNLNSKDGRSDRLGGRASMNFLSSSVSLEGSTWISENSSFLLSGRRSHTSKPFRPFLRQDVPLSFYDAFYKATLESWGGGRVSFRGLVSRDDVISANTSNPDYAWLSNGGALSVSGLVANRMYGEIVIFGTRYRSERDGKSSRVNPSAYTQVREIGVRANATVYGDEGELYQYGFESILPTAEYDFINRNGIRLRIHEQRPEVASWFRYQKKAGDFTFDGGIHSDFFSFFNYGFSLSTFQPRLTVSYKLNELWRMKIAQGWFNQTFVALTNEDDVLSIFQGWTRIPEYLQYESATHSVAGVEGFLSAGLSVNVQTYFKYYDKLFAYNKDQIDIRDPQYMNGIGKSYGLEFLVRSSLRLLDIYAAYTLASTRVDLGGYSYYPRYDRRHTLNALAVFHPIERLDIGFRWELGSGLPFTQTVGYFDRLTLSDVFEEPQGNETGAPYIVLGEKNAARMPWFHRLDASVSYVLLREPVKGTVGISLINLYDRRNVFYFDRKTGQTIYSLPFITSATVSIDL